MEQHPLSEVEARWMITVVINIVIIGVLEEVLCVCHGVLCSRAQSVLREDFSCEHTPTAGHEKSRVIKDLEYIVPI